MTQKLRVLLVDDHQMFRDALRNLLEKWPRVTVVGEAGDGLEVVKLAQATLPDIVCMDIGLPGMNGIETTRSLLAVCPGIKLIGVSAHSDLRYAQDMFEAGAMGYISKSGAATELRAAIEAVAINRKYLCPVMSSLAADSVSGTHDGKSIRLYELGARERQVLQLVAEGGTSAQIAERLHIAHSTVEVHRRNIMRKLNLHSVAELTRYAISNGLSPT